MKIVKKIKTRTKIKPQTAAGSVKRSLELSPKTAGPNLHKDAIREETHELLEGLVSHLNKSHVSLGKKIRQQTDELKEKNGQLRQEAVRLKHSDEQVQILTQAIEAAVDGIFIIDALKPNYPVIYSNPAFQTMTGYHENEVKDKNYYQICGSGGNLSTAAAIQRALAEGDYFYSECLNLNKSGDKYRSQLRISPVRGASGAISHYVGIQTDITQMRQKEQEIEEQREELLHVTRVGKLAEFVSSLAHEISQPLTAILSYTQAARRLLDDREPEIRKVLQFISDDDTRAIEVIRRLRSLLKKGEPEMKLLDINLLINDTIALVNTDATVRNALLNTELDTTLPQVNGDRIQLQQVLLNLISNSFDALEDCAENRKLTIRTVRQNDLVAVSVEDSGCGIPAPDLPKLFSRFFTSKADGLGMGLSISRSIVEAHGGRLDGKNNPEHGATFTFTLPLAKNQPL